jgi:hypothetical protein
MAPPEPPERRHRIKIRVLVVLASILAFLAIFTSWVDQQVFDTNQWVDTSGKLLEDKEISDALAVYAVDQLYANVDVSSLVKKRLPQGTQQLSAPISAGIRQVGTRAAEQALQTPRVQAAWKDANRVAHQQLITILKGDNEAVKEVGGKVVLDLRPLVLQLADRVGLKKQLNSQLPPDVGQLEVADAKELNTARTVAKLIQGFAWLFSIGSIALFGVAVYLAVGRRWVVCLGYGLGLIAAGLAAIVVRSILKPLFVHSLAETDVATTPADHAWDIVTGLLHSIASTVIIYGVLFVVAAYLASPQNGAVSIRQALAPWLRDRPAIPWSIFAALSVLVLIIWPPGGPRQLVVALLLIALAGIGLKALSRTTRTEFPDAQRGDWLLGMRQRARRMSAEASRRVSSALKDLADDERHPDDAKIDRLERLGQLKDRGILSDDEFSEEKQRILSGTG